MPVEFFRKFAGILAGLALVALGLARESSRPPSRMLYLAEGQTFRCGPTPPGSFGRHAWLIENVGPSPLRIRTRFTSGRSGFSLWQGEEHVIAAGEKIRASLTWSAPGAGPTPFASYATLRTNDPECPEIRLSVVGRAE